MPERSGVAAAALRQAGLPPLWGRMAVAAAVIAGTGNLVGLLLPYEIYGRGTPALADAAMAQDVANLILVAPATVALVLRACRGHMLAWLWRVDVLTFTAYSYSIYLFSVHFGPLFLLWVAVLGLSVFTLVGSLSALGAVLAGPGRLGRLGRALRLPGWFLVGAALLFATMWLGEILPDLLAGTGSASAAAWRVPSNPVHVLDLAIFLPAVAASGVLLLRRSRLGAVIAPGALVFLALTCVPILVTPFVAQARGAAPGWAVFHPSGSSRLSQVPPARTPAEPNASPVGVTCAVNPPGTAGAFASRRQPAGGSP